MANPVLIVIQAFKPMMSFFFLIFSFISLSKSSGSWTRSATIAQRSPQVQSTPASPRTVALSWSQSPCRKKTNWAPHPLERLLKGGLYGYRSFWDLFLWSWGILKMKFRYFHEIPDFIFLDP